MNPWLIIIALFALITIVLFKTKHERHFLFFVIRTKYGIKLINYLARLRPDFWMFMGDLGVLVSFSGLGVLYLLKHEKSRKNTYFGLILIVLMGVYLSKVSLLAKLLSGIILVGAIMLLNKVKNTAVVFALASLLISYAVGAAVPKMPLYLVLFFGFLGFPAVIIALLVQNAYDILQGSMIPGVSPLLPTTKDGNIGMGVPGYDIFIPWWYAVIAIVATFGPHEISHGILSRVGRIKLKSTGLLTFGGLLLGAFVEPDEEDLKSKPSISKMRVYSAGSIANFAVGILCILIILALPTVIKYVTYSEGVKVVDLNEGYPAEKVLEKGAIIYELNNITMDEIYSFEKAAGGLKPGDLVVLKTDNGVVMLNATKSPIDEEKGYMGVIVVKNIRSKFGFLTWLLTPGLLNFILNSLAWIYFFSLSIGTVNLLPVPPFDGYRMFDEIINNLRVKEGEIKRIIYGTIAVTLIVFFLNMFPLIRMALNYFLEIFGL